MSLPNFKNNQKGQILIIFLLVLVIGLAITLSIASRTVTDVRQTTTSDESNRAYFAAEAGVERALKELNDNVSFSTGTTPIVSDFSSVNNSRASTSVGLLQPTGTQVFAYPGEVAKDDVAQVSLITNFNDLGSAGLGHNESLEVYWGKETATDPTAYPALEFILVTRNTFNGVWDVKKWTFDPNSARRSGNNFCDPGFSNPSSMMTNTNVSIDYRFLVTINFATAQCNSDRITDSNDKPILARIKMLYNPGQVGVRRGGGLQLPSQGSQIQSTGFTDSGVARKLTVDRLHSTLPSLFDYALFNGSTTNALQK